MTILFVDLVGFTERSDTADPEDVRRTLVPFHEQAKAAIERYGGTLDKFIGDAAMGVFGAPVAHEDDPERAVRAALDLVAASSRRVTRSGSRSTRGEAVVTMGTGPQVGEAVAGDVVNTASRMQSAGAARRCRDRRATWIAVRDRFETEEREPFTAKGKAEPIRVWRCSANARRRPGPVTSLVGRERELAMLHDTWRAPATSGARSWSPIVAEPGIGKSRLVLELRLGSPTTSAGCRALRALRRHERVRIDARGRPRARGRRCRRRAPTRRRRLGRARGARRVGRPSARGSRTRLRRRWRRGRRRDGQCPSRRSPRRRRACPPEAAAADRPLVDDRGPPLVRAGAARRALGHRRRRRRTAGGAVHGAPRAVRRRRRRGAGGARTARRSGWRR